MRRALIARKGFLRRVYEEWYRSIVSQVPSGGAPVLELGSGPSFLKDHLPGLVMSDVQWEADLDVVLDGLYLPLARESLRAIVMTNVLHHLPEVRLFFNDAARTVRPGGAIVLIEPWVTGFSRLVYAFHHEPFRPDAADWSFPPGGPLSGANGALPWIVFARDRAIFEREFPMWQIEKIEPMMPLVYLLSGGVSMRSLMPAWSFPMWSAVEQALAGFRWKLGMIAMIVLRRRPR
jgi:SAM-dependent methyltransferase